MHLASLVTFLPSCVLLLAIGCAASTEPPPEPGYASVRERLESEDTRLLVTGSPSAGSIRAEHLSGDGWDGGLVELHVETGELALRGAGNAILVERFALGLAPIELPVELTGIRTQLVDIRAELREPALVPAAWSADDSQAHVAAKVKLDLSWRLLVDGSAISLGAPTLPPLPLEVTLGGDGNVAHAEIRIAAVGELWSWADLVRLVDLVVVATAEG